MNLFNTSNFERQGNTENDIHLDNIDDIRKSVNQLATTALRTIKIFTPDLEHETYNNDIFQKALMNLIRGNRHAQIQILVSDSSAAIHHGHRLISLARQLTSAMQIRNTPEDYQYTHMTFILVDQSGFVFKPDGAVQNAIVSNCKYRSNKLQEFFTPAWEQAEQDPQVREVQI